MSAQDLREATCVASPVLAGRSGELSLLDAAFDGIIGAGHAGAVLIAAEVGGGKSRLIREFVGHVADRAYVVAGACLEQSDGALPYAPFNAALRQLVRERGIADVSALAGGASAGDLARLLPAFGPPLRDVDPDLARVRLFEVFQHLAERLAAERPLVWVVEDVHWADGGTRDLLAFLTRNLERSPVLFVVSYRSDEVAPHHALRPFLAELSRGKGVVSITLPRLSRQEVADQLTGILGRPPLPAMVSAIYERSAGVPLFTEALVNADGTLRDGLPGSLRDLLLTRVHELPDATQAVLRRAAVWGTRITHHLLAAVVDRDDDGVIAAVRDAAAAHVLTADADGYAFRHALIREVVHGDVVAGERATIHRAFAEALERDPQRSSETETSMALARHWSGAQEHARALRAAWHAAEIAGRNLAYAEQLQMLELVLDLWDRVPGAGELTTTDAVAVIELAADAACWAVESERGLALVERALAALAVSDDSTRTAAMLLQRAVMRQQQLLPGQLEDLQAAVARLQAPTRLRAEALGQLSRALMVHERHADAQPFAREMADLAALLNDDEYAIESRLTSAQLAAHDGDDTTSTLGEAVQTARRLSLGRIEVLSYVGLLEAVDHRGAHERAIAIGQDAWVRIRQLGQGRYMGATVAHFLTRALTAAGRWDEALGFVEQALAVDPGPFGRAQLLVCRGQIAVARGVLQEAAVVIDELRSLAAGPQAARSRALSLACLEIDFAIVTGDLDGALRCAAEDRISGAHPRQGWPFLTAAVRASIEAKRPAASMDVLAAAAAVLPQPGAPERAHAAMFAAEMSRVDGRGDAAAWDAAANAWRTLGRPHPRAYALLRSAAAWMARDRVRASDRLHQAAELAVALDAGPLRAHIAALANRARIDLAGVGQAIAPGAASSLTSRELEVLRGVVAGLSNREIAAELFISVKTASVHVSNILAKLDVRTRGAAAAAAHRLHLLDFR